MLESSALAVALSTTLPPPVAYSHACVLSEEAALTRNEQIYIARAGKKRRLEFATGRRCALAALASIGRGVPGLGRENDGCPRWPTGIVGSISHCDGLCVAAVSTSDKALAIGVDVERCVPLPDGVLPLVASAEEISLLGGPHIMGPVAAPLDTVLFSAKESVFKAIYPTVRRYFGFEDITVKLSLCDGEFTAWLRLPLCCSAERQSVRGRFALADGHIITAVIVRKAEERQI